MKESIRENAENEVLREQLLPTDQKLIIYQNYLVANLQQIKDTQEAFAKNKIEKPNKKVEKEIDEWLSIQPKTSKKLST